MRVHAAVRPQQGDVRGVAGRDGETRAQDCRPQIPLELQEGVNPCVTPQNQRVIALPQPEAFTPFEPQRERRMAKCCSHRLGTSDDIRERAVRIMNRCKGDVQAIPPDPLPAQAMRPLQAQAQTLDGRACVARWQ